VEYALLQHVEECSAPFLLKPKEATQSGNVPSSPAETMVPLTIKDAPAL